MVPEHKVLLDVDHVMGIFRVVVAQVLQHLELHLSLQVRSAGGKVR